MATYRFPVREAVLASCLLDHALLLFVTATVRQIRQRLAYFRVFALDFAEGKIFLDYLSCSAYVSSR